jgi:aminoglycoside phosphotransferase (APT) family kinase protein
MHAETSDKFSDERLQARLADFLRGKGAEDPRIGRLKRYTAGFSWITYELEAAWRDGKGRHERDLILRIGPDNGLFAPYTARPEFIALSCLKPAGVPLPTVRWFCDDREVLGAPFLIYDRIEGEAPLPWSSGGEPFDDGLRKRLGEEFIAVLSALHRFDWRGTGAHELPGPETEADAAPAQIRTWEGWLRQWSERSFPMLERALLWLKRNAPPAPRITLVHGDYRIGNFLHVNGRITGILDWELVHRGDPHEDLGWMCLPAFRGRSPYMCHLITREELCRRYAELTGSPVSSRALHYYEAFGAFKLAVIHLGASHCFERRGNDDLRMALFGAQMPRLLLQLERLMEGSP